MKWFLNCKLCGMRPHAKQVDKKWLIKCGSKYVDDGCGLILYALPGEQKENLIKRWNKLNDIKIKS